MGSSGSSAGSLRRSNQSSRTGLGGRGCCAAAVSGKVAAALLTKAINSRLFIVASLVLRRRLYVGFAVWDNAMAATSAALECSPRLTVKATSLVGVRKGRACGDA